MALTKGIRFSEVKTKQSGGEDNFIIQFIFQLFIEDNETGEAEVETIRWVTKKSEVGESHIPYSDLTQDDLLSFLKKERGDSFVESEFEKIEEKLTARLNIKSLGQISQNTNLPFTQ